jgi:7-carboxy-7-deazaguanine synthase
MQRLIDMGLSVSLETSGALSVEKVPDAVIKVLDLKTPGSNESHRNLWTNLQYLTPQDQIKFVLCGRVDYDWARMRCDEHGLYNRVGDVLFSPSHHELAPRDLADWIVADRLPVRMQMQMHKLLWGDVPGR